MSSSFSNMFWLGNILNYLCVVFFVGPSSSLSNFRLDYTYNKKVDAFYKFHIEAEFFERAKTICNSEGASIMIPSTEWDISISHGLYKQYPDIDEYAWIGTDEKSHDSGEEREPIIQFQEYEGSDELQFNKFYTKCNVISRDGDIMKTSCFKRHPFFCKVSARDIYIDQVCQVFGRDYQYFENVGSCYKIPRIIFSWNQAYDECLNEGSHLVILNSELEHQVVRNITNESPKIPDAKTSWSFWAGIRAHKTTDGSPIVFKTIFNQTLEETGYAQWSEKEPNNYGGDEYCVSIFKNDGKYNDLCCSHYYGFVCEKEVNKLTN